MILKSTNNQKNVSRLSGESGTGFTLIELVVVLGLFMLIMSVTVNLFISIVRQQKRILSQQEMLNQVSYVQDYFSRSLRSASIDTNGNCLVDGEKKWTSGVYLLTHFNIETGFYQGVKFLSQEQICQEFFLDSDGTLREKKDGGSAQNILSAKFSVPYARFIINGNKSIRAVQGGGAVQPRVSIALDVKDMSHENSQEMVVQTTVSRR